MESLLTLREQRRCPSRRPRRVQVWPQRPPLTSLEDVRLAGYIPIPPKAVITRVRGQSAGPVEAREAGRETLDMESHDVGHTAAPFTGYVERLA